ncbi:hypothetical protein HYV50_03060 [Candidatus Pacearchaeota archaeon]|nr:hypothetical protein [Candidatus Pacearchaeota archaeon]
MENLKITKTSWDLSPLLESDDDPKIEKIREQIKNSVDTFVSKWKNNDSYLKNPELLKKSLEEYEKIRANNTSGDDGAGTIDSFYFWLRMRQDQNDPEIKAKYNKSMEFANKIINDLRFFTLKIAKIPEKEQNKFLHSPELSNYRHYLEKLFIEAKYNLSEDEEKIMSLKAKTSHENWVKMLSGFISKEEHEVLMENDQNEIKNCTEIISLISNQNKKIRDSAAHAFNDILKK